MEEDEQRLEADPDLKTYLQDVLLGVTRQQSSQSGIWEFLQRAGAEALPQASDVHVDQSLLTVLADPARYALRHHGYCADKRDEDGDKPHPASQTPHQNQFLVPPATTATSEANTRVPGQQRRLFTDEASPSWVSSTFTF